MKKKNYINQKNIYKLEILLTTEKDNSKKIYESIIESKNKFYSVLSLNMILEKNLEKNQEKILKYFRIVESVKSKKNKKNF